MSSILGVLTVLTLTSLSSGVYVQTGSDITDCSMKCPGTDGVLQLYKVCGGYKRHLLDLWCDHMWSNNHFEPRLRYNTSSGCWTLKDAKKDDSCVYNVVYYGNGGRFLTILDITVLDPVLISGITSTGSRLGQDIAVSSQFPGEETNVILEVDGRPLLDDNRTLIIPNAQNDDDGRKLSIRIPNPVSEENKEYQLEITDPRSSRLPSSPGVFAAVWIILFLVILSIVLSVKFHTRAKPVDVEKQESNNLSEEHGRLTGSSSDQPGDKKQENGEKNLVTMIHRIWKRIWNKTDYGQTPQIEGGTEMKDLIRVIHAENQ